MIRLLATIYLIIFEYNIINPANDIIKPILATNNISDSVFAVSIHAPSQSFAEPAIIIIPNIIKIEPIIVFIVFFPLFFII